MTMPGPGTASASGPAAGNTPATAYVGLGANLGDSGATLRVAARELAATDGITACVVSPFYRSAPVDATGPDFVNAVARVETTLPPLALLHVLQALEARHGRQRPYRHAPRTLDLDLLLYENIDMDSEHLTLPHPRMQERAFVLRPLLDLAPDMVLERGPVAALLAQCAGQVVEPIGA